MRLAAAIDDCRAFESRYRGQIAAFDGATLADALAEREREPAVAASDLEHARRRTEAQLLDADVDAAKYDQCAAVLRAGMARARRCPGR